MKPSVWLHKGNFRRLNIFSKFVNCQDTGWDLYTKYNKYHRGISLTANYQELPLLSCGKMHYLNLVLWSFVNKLRQENKTISSSLLSCKIAQQWDALWDWRSESMERCVQSFSCFLASFPLTLPSIFCDMYMWNFKSLTAAQDYSWKQKIFYCLSGGIGVRYQPCWSSGSGISSLGYMEALWYPVIFVLQSHSNWCSSVHDLIYLCCQLLGYMNDTFY